MRKTFDIKDKDVLEHLKKQPNQTKYIIGLIRKDMQSSEIITKEEVIKLIEQYINTLGYKVTCDKKDDDVKKSINNMLSILKAGS